VHAELRARVPFYSEDRYFSPDLHAARDWVRSGRFREFVVDLLPSVAAR
jgi:histidine ammonia-lyase